MTLHTAVKMRDRRWPLEWVDRDRLGTDHAVDPHGQRWKSTRHRRWQSTQWQCGHIGEMYEESSVDYRGRVVTTQRIHHGHNRYWERVNKKRGVASPDKLCEMTATVSPHGTGHTVNLIGMARTA